LKVLVESRETLVSNSWLNKTEISTVSSSRYK